MTVRVFCGVTSVAMGLARGGRSVPAHKLERLLEVLGIALNWDAFLGLWAGLGDGLWVVILDTANV